MAYTFFNNQLGMQPIADTSTTQNHPLGLIAQASDPTYGQAEFIYLAGVATTVAGSWVTYNDDDGTTTLAIADAIGPVGIAMSANVASQYGWYMIRGKAAVGLSLTAGADNALVWLTACAGYVDDASVAGDWVNLAKYASTSTARQAEFEIDRPFVNNNSNSA